MKKSLKLLYIIVPLFASMLAGQGCNMEIQNTTVAIRDSIRHYSPIIMGQKIKLSFALTNTGKYPLIIADVLPSCGCVAIVKDVNQVVPAGSTVYIPLIFDSSKNTGYVMQEVRVYGNISPDGVALMSFDLNVVPRQNETRDYEEIYQDEHPAGVILKSFSSNMGYGERTNNK